MALGDSGLRRVVEIHGGGLGGFVDGLPRQFEADYAGRVAARNAQWPRGRNQACAVGRVYTGGEGEGARGEFCDTGRPIRAMTVSSEPFWKAGRVRWRRRSGRAFRCSGCFCLSAVQAAGGTSELS